MASANERGHLGNTQSAIRRYEGRDPAIRMAEIRIGSLTTRDGLKRPSFPAGLRSACVLPTRRLGREALADRSVLSNTKQSP